MLRDFQALLVLLVLLALQVRPVRLARRVRLVRRVKLARRVPLDCKVWQAQQERWGRWGLPVLQGCKDFKALLGRQEHPAQRVRSARWE